jgi:hypothetical protein
MDGIVLEVSRDDQGRVMLLHPVDPDTIFEGAMVNGARHNEIKYVQVIDGRAVQEFTARDLIVAKVGRIA